MQAAVNPTAEAPFPEAYIHLLIDVETHFNNWDLATPGSPINRVLISPLTLCLFFISLGSPPNSDNAIACLAERHPDIDGAMEDIIFS